MLVFDCVCVIVLQNVLCLSGEGGLYVFTSSVSFRFDDLLPLLKMPRRQMKLLQLVIPKKVGLTSEKKNTSIPKSPSTDNHRHNTTAPSISSRCPGVAQGWKYHGSLAMNAAHLRKKKRWLDVPGSWQMVSKWVISYYNLLLNWVCRGV